MPLRVRVVILWVVACAIGLCTLHLLADPFAGVFRAGRHRHAYHRTDHARRADRYADAP
jgi:hypothetical protein